jgi:3-dehydroquinate dehydratase-2
MRIFIVNGPNLNLLGKREPSIYGHRSLWDLENDLKAAFPSVKFEFFQSNHEGSIIDTLHKAMDGMVDGIVINPAAYSHTSYAIRDAIAALPIPVVEVHISNINAREEFRRTSVTAPACKTVVSGMGFKGYEMGVRYLVEGKNR